MKCRDRQILLCDCERTMSLDGEAIAKALEAQGTPRIHHNLCRSEIAAYNEALASDSGLLVACTQEAPLFREIAEESETGTHLGFVNIRERAGWCEDAGQVDSKVAALLAEALVEAEPAGTKTVRSEGVCLVYGRGQQALDVAQQLSSRLSVSLLLTESGDMAPPTVADVPVHRGRIAAASGSLGNFEIVVDGYAPMVPSSRGQADFVMARDGASSQCDLILDLSGETPLFTGHDKRDGYFRADPDHPAAVASAMFEITDYVGEFEKPLYVAYDPDICAHSRSRKTGCSNCLDACPAGAIASAGDVVEIDHGICGGCGSCSASCPTGAVSYRYPRREDLIRRIQILVATYLGAGGERPVLLVHDDRHGGPLIAMMARFGRGLPVNVLPLSVFSVTEIGHDILAAAFVAGVEQIIVLAHPSKVAELPPLQFQATLADAFLAALGRGEEPRVTVVEEADPAALESMLHELPARPALPAASFSAVGGKRDIARGALARLRETSPERPEIIALPDGAPYGRIIVDAEGCTLCLACVGACPMGAILDSPDHPQLRFQEHACVQCGLCRDTCPEGVISLEPRYDFTPAALEQVVLHEDEPFACVRCGKPFGTRKSIERISEKLTGKHWMFQSQDAGDLIRMCDTCRIQAQAERGDDPFQAGERPRVRVTEDYLSAREAGSDLDVDDFLKD
jgi:ferredoxin